MSANDAANSDRILVLQRLVEAAFGPDTTIAASTDAGEGRGIFSDVRRLFLQGPRVGTGEVPANVVAKLPAAGPNGDAAITTGAVEREAIAYTQLLTADSPVQHPTLYAIDRPDAAVSFLLSDLAVHRAVDQLDGLSPDDALAVVAALGQMHRWARDRSLPIRENTPTVFAPTALEQGLKILEPTWNIATDTVSTFRALLDQRPTLLDTFAALPSTICHGDARADNLVFADNGKPVFFDWQQISRQSGGADVAWLLATSLEPATRRAIQTDAATVYGDAAGVSSADAAAAIRIGYLLPGLAVLMLAQRTPDTPRTEAFIRSSITRIAAAVAEYGPVS